MGEKHYLVGLPEITALHFIWNGDTGIQACI